MIVQHVYTYVHPVAHNLSRMSMSDDAYVTPQSVLYSTSNDDCSLSEGSRRDSMTFVHFFLEMYG